MSYNTTENTYISILTSFSAALRLFELLIYYSKTFKRYSQCIRTLKRDHKSISHSAFYNYKIDREYYPLVLFAW